MAISRYLPATRAIVDCPQWPTMYLLPPLVTGQLDGLVLHLRRLGYPVYRKDVVGLLVMYTAPARTPSLRRLVEAYQLANAPALRGRNTTTPVMLTLPSPVTLRIDALVTEVRSLGNKAYRQELLGALVSSAFTRRPALPRLYGRYRRAHAKDARVVGQPVRTVLALQRPNPGPRSW